MLVTVNTERKDAFLEKVVKLNKRIGSAFFQPKFVRTYTEKFPVAVDSFYGSTVEEEFSFTEFEIENSVWKLDDETEVVAVYKTTLETGAQIVTPFGSDESVPEEFFAVDNTQCDHCGTKHQRVKQFLLLIDGEYKIIGSTCVKDFCGWDLEIIAKFMEFPEELNFAIKGSGKTIYSVDYILYLALAITNKNGYTTVANAEDNLSVSASDAVKGLIGDAEKVSEYFKLQNIDKEATRKAADNLLKEAEDFLEKDNSHAIYVSNLRSAILAGGVTFDHIGLVASTIIYVNNQKERLQKENGVGVSTSHFGNVGKRYSMSKASIKAGRIPFEVKILRNTTTESYLYGSSEFFVAQTTEQQDVTFSISWSKDDLIHDLIEAKEKGFPVMIGGTVKEHGTYNDHPSTRLNRAVIVSIIKPKGEENDFVI